tara:strand:- start:1660 stop:3231 length:1572 start_codon:yes stop_codon:yes gene_type:complete
MFRHLNLFSQNHLGKYKYLDKLPSKIKEVIDNIKRDPPILPIVIGGNKIYKNLKPQFCPYDNTKIVSMYSQANYFDVEMAIKKSLEGKKIWNNYSLDDKIDIFNRAADLVETKYEAKLIASTMIGQGKVLYEAEIDAISELSDFFRFNCQYMKDLHNETLINTDGVENKMHWTSLPGFVASITPFNFTAIGGNLATAPLLMGNTVIWKPSDYSMLSNYYIYELLLEAGLPSKVLQFLPVRPDIFMNIILKSSDFGCLAFTGSSSVFKSILYNVYRNIDLYKSFPRVIGETGGNNYHFVFPDVDLDTVVKKTIIGAYGYSGQKCSATKRIYVPKSLYSDFIDIFKERLSQQKIGSPEDHMTFTSAVIHKESYNKCYDFIMKYQNKIIVGGLVDGDEGHYIHPTLIEETYLHSEIWKKEIFGPILIVHPYADEYLERTAKICTEISGTNLTGAVFYDDDKYEDIVDTYFKNSVGNFYINDKSTGSVVGQQPFGGFGLSGTNDKAGSKYFLTRFGNSVVTKRRIIK